MVWYRHKGNPLKPFYISMKYIPRDCFKFYDWVPLRYLPLRFGSTYWHIWVGLCVWYRGLVFLIIFINIVNIYWYITHSVCRLDLFCIPPTTRSNNAPNSHTHIWGIKGDELIPQKQQLSGWELIAMRCPCVSPHKNEFFTRYHNMYFLTWFVVIRDLDQRIDN